jgi:hypothetical protein
MHYRRTRVDGSTDRHATFGVVGILLSIGSAEGGSGFTWRISEGEYNEI